MRRFNRVHKEEGMKTLILDDDPKLGKLVVDYLAKNGGSARNAVTVKDFERLLKQDPPDVVVLDVMLPEKDGFQVLRELRGKRRILPSSCSPPAGSFRTRSWAWSWGPTITFQSPLSRASSWPACRRWPAAAGP